MGKGKNLIFTGGILTLIGTYALTWFSFAFGTIQYAYGVGGIKNFMDLLFPSSFYVKRLELDRWLIQVIAILMLFFLISGILQLIGKKRRFVGLVGTIMPLLMGIGLILGGSITLLAFILRYLEIYGDPDPLIAGLLPIHWIIYGRVSIGSFVVLAGGILGLIGVIMSKEEFY